MEYHDKIVAYDSKELSITLRSIMMLFSGKKMLLSGEILTIRLSKNNMRNKMYFHINISTRVPVMYYWNLYLHVSV
jgi:glycine cleavage system regulatory protein